MIKNHIDIKKKVRINLNIKSIIKNLRKKYEINYENSQQEFVKSKERVDRIRIEFDESLQFNKFIRIKNEINDIKSKETSYRKCIESCENLQFKDLIHNVHDMYFEKIENEIKLFEKNIINIFFQKNFKKIIDDEKKQIEYNNKLKRNIFIKTLKKYANYKIKRILPKNENNKSTINKNTIVKVNKIIIPNNTQSKDEIERDLIVIKIRIRTLQNQIIEEFLKENSKIFTKNEMNDIIINILFIENNLKILTRYESYKDFYHTKSILNRKIYKEYFTTLTNYGNIIIDYEQAIQILIHNDNLNLY